MGNTTSDASGPRQPHRESRPSGSGKGGGAARQQNARPAAGGPGPGASRTGSNPGLVENGATVRAIQQSEALEEQAGGPGFSEEQTKDVEMSSGGGLAAQDDPDTSLRGEDQLVDGDSVLDPISDE